MPKSKIKQLKLVRKGKKSSVCISAKVKRKKSAKQSIKSQDPFKPKQKHGFQPGNTLAKEYWWKPGESGNPAGRPKGLDMTNSLRKLLDQPAVDVPFVKERAAALGIEIEEDDKSILVVDVLMTSGLLHSMSGKSDLFKQVWERIEGSVKKNISINEGDPFEDYLAAMKAQTTFDQMKEEE